MFWQLGARNLFPELVHLPTGSQKLFVNSILARRAAWSASAARQTCARVAVRAGQGRRPSGTILPHGAV